MLLRNEDINVKKKHTCFEQGVTTFEFTAIRFFNIVNKENLHSINLPLHGDSVPVVPRKEIKYTASLLPGSKDEIRNLKTVMQ